MSKLKIFGIFFREPGNGVPIPKFWWRDVGSVYITNQPKRKIRAQWSIYDALCDIGQSLNCPDAARNLSVYSYEGDK